MNFEFWMEEEDTGRDASCVLRMVSIRRAGECDEIVTVHVRC